MSAAYVFTKVRVLLQYLPNLLDIDKFRHAAAYSSSLNHKLSAVAGGKLRNGSCGEKSICETS